MVNRRKILYFTTQSVWDDAGKYTGALALQAARLNFDAAVAAGGCGALAAHIASADIPYHEIRGLECGFAPRKDGAAFFQILKILFTFRPNILHASDPKAAALGGLAFFMYRVLLLRFDSKSIYTVHGWAFHKPTIRTQKKLSRISSRALCYLYNVIIVLSLRDHTAALEYRIAPKEKLALIPSGADPMDIDFFDRVDARAKLLEPRLRNHIIIGAIGEFAEHKGHRYLLEAFASLQRTLRVGRAESRLHLLFIGWGDYAGVLRKKAEQLKIENDITIVAHTSPASPYLSAIDIFVLPSQHEGLPSIVLEAGLAALPVIATDTGGTADIIKHEKTGLLVPISNAGKIAVSLERFIRTPSFAYGLGDNLRDHVIKNFPLHAMLARTFAVY